MMGSYSENLSDEDLDRIFDALPTHPINGEEVSAILVEVVKKSCEDDFGALALLGQAVSLLAAYSIPDEPEMLQ